MANSKKYEWNTTPVDNPPNDSAWQEFVAGATKERIRKERKAELDKQKNENAKPKTPMTGADWVKFVILVIISIAFIMPILLVLMNSFKTNVSVSNEPFAFPNGDNFVGFDNYTNGVEKINFFPAFFTSIFVTVFSVAFIILCTSMCAWFITRVKTWYTKLMYLLFAFSMIVPFQMVMYPMSFVANQLSLDNMFGIVVIYLGFGAGLSVFMFAGFIKSVPLEIEEAAMIDGCGPIRTFFMIDFPILMPSAITVDMERLPPPHTHPQQTENSAYGNTVSAWRLRLDRYGCNDGNARTCNNPDHYLLLLMSEVYHQRRCCRCCQRLIHITKNCISAESGKRSLSAFF